MSKFIFKQIYRLFPYALFFICLIFLFCNHLDTLASEIPAQAEIYFHANAKDIQQIPREQKDIILNWLEKGSTVSRDSWQELFNASADEIGIFTLNKQIFGITKNNPAVISILQNRNIEFSLNENALYFPSLNVADKKISTEPWYMESKRKINFAKYNLFLKNSSAIAILQSFSEINTTKPVSAFGKLENNHLIFNI
ncbi:hypothetical protein KKA13_04810, partial [Patescibacteria group bacterium]|nr:hypothetical protein [Patescibacteria group bacterium]